MAHADAYFFQNVQLAEARKSNPKHKEVLVFETPANLVGLSVRQDLFSQSIDVIFPRFSSVSHHSVSSAKVGRAFKNFKKAMAFTVFMLGRRKLMEESKFPSSQKPSPMQRLAGSRLNLKNTALTRGASTLTLQFKSLTT